MTYRRYPRYSPDRLFAWTVIAAVIVGFGLFAWWFWS